MSVAATSWIDQFRGLSQLKSHIREILINRSTIVSVPKDTVIFGPGKAPENLLLLLSGCVRVQQLSEGGREIILYRVHAGESCVLTTACLLAYEDYSAEGIAETDVQAVAIPRLVFDDLIAQSETFRRFVFSAYSKRITDLFLVIEEIAFQRMDIRLAQKLIELAGEGNTVATTHQQMAAELGTAREVISRQLREFQRRDWVTQSRGAVELIDRAGLEKLAATEV
ncbi:Crp/Fnr family transcriptional regulator [Pseudovibrio sp. Tun.PSC04-5.I4]|uniref:Crp/Fnr family transcriptional regulator n=1 Tax=Pseudovibrio sp. Tun.PSC04-5.I4 TaxID=1798213 RepID=UPI0008872298|nr:Crp/Fnr family transcriptional regulator [Pseudovibrio sp. Tun.PSC04-5.I4]SDR47167.1 cyclic nucleotide-binding protein [Pseudovibrio sp. Tun.PSC04-5.I4]